MSAFSSDDDEAWAVVAAQIVAASDSDACSSAGSDWSRHAATRRLSDDDDDDDDDANWEVVQAQLADAPSACDAHDMDADTWQVAGLGRRRGRPSRGDEMLRRLVPGHPQPRPAAPGPLPAAAAEPELANLQSLHVLARQWMTMRAFSNGIVQPNVFVDLLAAVHIHAKGVAIDDPYVSFVVDAQLGQRLHLRSMSSQADHAGVDRRTIGRIEDLQASVGFHTQFRLWWCLEKYIVYNVAESALLLYGSKARYDETPMSLRTFGFSSKQHAMPQLCQDALQDYRDSIAKHESSHSLSMTLWAPGLCEKAETSSDHAKIIQVENTNVLLLELSAEHYVGIVAEFGNHLAVVERTTARCMLSVLLHQMCISPACQRYKCRLRLPNTDDAASNNLCESSVAAVAKHGQWKMMHDLCEVHIVASVYKAMYQLLHVEFQGVLHFALSTKHGAAMNVFRKALRLEIRSRGVRICQGASPTRCKTYSENMVRIFCSSGGHLLSRKMLLLLLPNGDWGQHAIEIYIGDVDAISEKQAIDMITNGIMTACCSTNFEILNRSRWLKNEVCIDRCGMLEAIHNLGSGTYRRFVALMAGSTNSSEVILPYSIDGHSQQQAIGDHGLLAGKPDDEVDGVPSIGAGADSNGRGDSNDFAKQNDTHRRIAAAWWQTSPLCMLVVMRLVLEPLRRLMLSQFDVSWEEW